MIVVDCSAVIDALVAADDNDVNAVLSTRRLAAPHLLDFEVVAAVRGLVLGRRISHQRGSNVLAAYDQLLLTRWGSAADLRRRSLELRDNFSAYDAAYVVLAEALDCPLLTRDRRLAHAADGIVEVEVV